MDFPEDPSGSFHKFKRFVQSNFEICKWVGLSILSIQGLSFLLSMVLKALGPHRYYDSDDEYYSPDRVPLLNNAVVHSPRCVVGDPVYGSRKDAWSIRINDKVIGLTQEWLGHGCEKVQAIKNEHQSLKTKKACT
ncbi:hypothetical protein HS088_TW06G00132 [Tripterygium wilfordii]|uniref:Uncharacterized protein n=1 Tax=Tripterygium wilfordii TaxID=458696 RepID=A0A7J7DHY8_TRIWF|nr:hypothetical protein HS088_TW06G00132 [Tripterygium wilfordii]